MKKSPKDEVANEWITLALADFSNAENIFRLELDPTYTTICFHAQQCVEKFIKAALVFHDIDFPKTHDIKELITLLKPHLNLKRTIPNPGQLTQFAVITRYPGSWSEITREEVETSLRAAIKVVNKVKRHLQENGLDI
jgi:HEPN domain-containing protein